MNVVDVSGLDKSFGSRQILDGASFAIGEDERVGLIGANGSGKSTLLSILAGLEDRDGGSITTMRGAEIGYLSQEPLLDAESMVGEALEGGLTEIRSVMAEYREIADRLADVPAEMEKLLLRQGELATWIEHHGGWNTDHRIEEIMTHLQIPDRWQRVGDLSGGTRRRVALGRLLLQAPDLLLLDEPTNHLDADTVQWLQEYLQTYPGAVLLITHDRYFLDQVVSRMLELDKGQITAYAGGYTSYLVQKEEKLQQAGAAHSRLLNLLRVETAWMQRGAKARTTKQKARIDRFHDIQEKSVRSRQRETVLDFAGDGKLGGTVLEILGVGKALGGRTLLKDLTLRLKRGDRVGIIGPNGCGKTTLVRMIMGEEPVDSGEIVVGKKTQIAYFDQLRTAIDEGGTIYDFLGEGDYVQVGGDKRHKIGYLEDFLFAPSDQRRPVSTLSGGEKSRLILARMMLAGANLLILDEPTNDLDIPTMQLLDDSLTRFPGCILMVTHDRFFLDKVATGILSFEGEGVATFYEGNYSHYRESKESAAETLRSAERAKGEAEQRPQSDGRPKAKKGLTYAERQELESAEEKIELLELRKGEVERALADPSLYENATGGIAGLSSEHARIEDELGRLYLRWEELETKKSCS